MSEKQEAFSDIIAKMRLDGIVHNSIPTKYLNAYADRLEAALKRELESVSGDAAKLREALKAVKKYLDGYTVNILELRRTVDIALAAPPRNCEVGTPDEQSERFDAHCRKYMGCKACPLRDADGSVPKHCEFRWAQMPYNESEANKCN